MGPNRKLQGGFLMKKHPVCSPTEKTVISESTKTNLIYRRKSITELKHVIPNMEKTFGKLEYAGEGKIEQPRINSRMTV